MKKIFFLLIVLVITLFANDLGKTKEIIRIETIQSYILNFEFHHLSKYWNLELQLPPFGEYINYGLGPSYTFPSQEERFDFLLSLESAARNDYKFTGYGLNFIFTIKDTFLESKSEIRIFQPLARIAVQRKDIKSNIFLNLKSISIGFEDKIVYHKMDTAFEIYESLFGGRIKKRLNQKLIFDIGVFSYNVQFKQRPAMNFETVLLKFAFEAEF